MTLPTFVFVASCADRDRVNPLDPKNPNTLGRPTGFRVISIQDTVFLSWDRIDLSDLNFYRIYRTTQLEEGFSVVAEPDKEQTSFKDVDVSFGADFFYTLSAVGQAYESPRSDTLSIMPGPSFGWIADRGGRQVLKLTHDSRHEILRTSSFAQIVDLEVDPTSGQLWVVENSPGPRGSVTRVSETGQLLGPRLQFDEPSDAALDETDGSIWIAEAGRGGLVSKINSDGQQLFSVGQFERPVSLSVDNTTGGCWVADRGANRASRISRSGDTITESEVPFSSIQSLSVNSAKGKVWIADSSAVLAMNDQGRLLFRLTNSFSGVNRVAVDAVTGDVWTIDISRSVVGKLTDDGSQLFEVAGFDHPIDFAVNSFDHSCLITDVGSDRVVRLSPQGEIVTIFEAVSEPVAVAIQKNMRRN